MWQLFKRKPDEGGAGDWEFAMALMTDPGCQRATNQDAGRLMRPPNHSFDAQKGLLAVIADGMGGHKGGEVASEMAIEAVCRAYYQQEGSPGESLASAMAHANRAIFDRASKDEQLGGMGTTCTALVLQGSFGYVAHVGDSRLYLIRHELIYQMTEDHSLVMEMVRNGILTAEQARTHPERNVLQRALGRRPEVEVSGWNNPIPLQLGDHFVLCSDGLPAVVTDETIRDLVLANHPAEACSSLIDLARERNAPDNVTVGVVRIDAARPLDAPLPETREVSLLPQTPDGPSQ